MTVQVGQGVQVLGVSLVQTVSDSARTVENVTPSNLVVGQGCP
jgi:hypothetical protein